MWYCATRTTNSAYAIINELLIVDFYCYADFLLLLFCGCYNFFFP